MIISVHNSGLGIAQQDLNRIMEKFYQGEKSHSTPGNGLGLAIVRQIAEIHGETVHASSSPEDGTVFVVKLPIHKCDTRRNKNHDSEK